MPFIEKRSTWWEDWPSFFQEGQIGKYFTDLKNICYRSSLGFWMSLTWLLYIRSPPQEFRWYETRAGSPNKNCLLSESFFSCRYNSSRMTPQFELSKLLWPWSYFESLGLFWELVHHCHRDRGLSKPLLLDRRGQFGQFQGLQMLKALHPDGQRH